MDGSGNVIHDFSYDDAAPWPLAADGTGPSLEVISTSGDYNDGTNWRASGEFGGSPGRLGAGPDTDGDGTPDSLEALFGTNPASGGSLPAVTLSVNGVSGAVTLSWPSVAGVAYRVENSDNLASWVALQTVTGVGTWSYTPEPGTARRYYRVVAFMP